MAGRVLFIYRVKDAACSQIKFYRALHGRREIRVTKDEFGRAEITKTPDWQIKNVKRR